MPAKLGLMGGVDQQSKDVFVGRWDAGQGQQVLQAGGSH
jgi:hypothetical protein